MSQGLTSLYFLAHANRVTMLLVEVVMTCNARPRPTECVRAVQNVMDFLTCPKLSKT